MDLKLSGKRCAITGASKGIGRAVAESLAAEGVDLDLTARNADALAAAKRELTERYNISVRTFAHDFLNPDEQAAFADEAAGADFLVNVAGAVPPGEIDTLSDEAFRTGLELKMFGYINLSRHFYTQMKSRQSGVIANVIGMSGVRLDPMNIAITTGNAALIAFTRALGARSVDFGVRVVGVNPALTATERAVGLMRSHAEKELGDPERWEELTSGMPGGRIGTPEEVADTVAFLLSPRAQWISGSLVNIDGGLECHP